MSANSPPNTKDRGIGVSGGVAMKILVDVACLLTKDVEAKEADDACLEAQIWTHGILSHCRIH